MRVRITGNAKDVVAGLRADGRRRKSVLRRGLANHGRRFIRETVRQDLSSRPGLNRRTGHAARSLRQRTLRRGSGFELVVYTLAPYVQYHTDDHVPKAEPRRFPARVLTGERWDRMAESDELLRSMPRDPITGDR